MFHRDPTLLQPNQYKIGSESIKLTYICRIHKYYEYSQSKLCFLWINMILSYLSGVNDLASLKTTVEKGLVRLFQTTRPNKQGTFPETNIVPENKPSQKETSIRTIHLQVRAVGFKEGNMLSCRATWSHLYRRHFLFARHTLSQMSHAGLGLLLETVLVSFFTQLPWFLLPMLSLPWHERMSIMQSSSCKSRTFGRRLIQVVVTPVLWRTASSACMRPIGHHRYWHAESHMLPATTRPAARYSRLKGCQVRHTCYLLLPACQKT